jgi:hypothetical protein
MESTYIVHWCAEPRADKEVPGVIMGVVTEEDDHPHMVSTCPSANTVNFSEIPFESHFVHTMECIPWLCLNITNLMHS